MGVGCFARFPLIVEGALFVVPAGRMSPERSMVTPLHSGRALDGWSHSSGDDPGTCCHVAAADDAVLGARILGPALSRPRNSSPVTVLRRHAIALSGALAGGDSKARASTEPKTLKMRTASPSQQCRIVHKHEFSPKGFRWLTLQRIEWQGPDGRMRFWESVERQTTVKDEHNVDGADAVAVVAKASSLNGTRLLIIKQFRCVSELAHSPVRRFAFLCAHSRFARSGPPSVATFWSFRLD